MTRILTLALLLAWPVSGALCQEHASDDGPLISLFLPHGFPSNEVQVHFFLIGPFGGYGSFVQPQSDRQVVDFRAAVNDKPADRVKVIAYLPGCELVALDFPLQGTAMWRQLECKPTPTVTFHGRIPSGYVGTKTEVRVSYGPDWAFDFFGIRDGLVIPFFLSKSTPTPSGEFTAMVPDFFRQNLGSGHYLLDLRCENCMDSSDRPIKGQTHREIQVSSRYPASIKFADAPSE